jgi:predicted transposase/invertase (TIGR01784 family)
LHAGDKYHELNPVFCIVITEFRIIADRDAVHLVFELRERGNPKIVLSDHLQIHFLQLYGLLNGRREILEGVSANLRRWLNFLVFDSSMEENEMSQLVENDTLVMSAVAELKHFAADPDMRELERRRKLWRLEYHSGLHAAKAEGVAIGEARGKADIVLLLLQKKFPKVPKRIEEAVRSMTDPTALESLAAHVVDCQSLEEFEKALH